LKDAAHYAGCGCLSAVLLFFGGGWLLGKIFGG